MSTSPHRSRLDDVAREGADDEAYLDAAFDAMLDDHQLGRPVDVERWISGRPELALELRDLARTLRAAVGRDVAPARRIGSFEIQREVGHGAMGTVYFAEQLTLGRRPVALKVLPSGVALSERARARFLHEARSLARVRHPHVVGVHEVLDEDGVLAFAMEWVDGCTLAQLIASVTCAAEPRSALARALPARTHDEGWPTFVCRVGIAMARALGAMHAAGLVHRDVKPSNILLRKDGTALLSDFGLVRDEALSLHTETGAALGTVGYAAPELLRGDHDGSGPEADVFGLGATLHHALCGVAPYGTGAPLDVLARIEARRLAPRRTRGPLPRDLETILETALEPSPPRRYRTAAALADDLERLLELRPILARRASPMRRAWRYVQRSRRVLLTSALGAALGVAVAGTIGWRAWRDSGRAVAAERAVNEARGLLLTHESANTSFIVVNALAEGQAGDSFDRLRINFAAETLAAALGAYTRALRLGRDDDATVSEHGVIELARALVGHGLDKAGRLATLRRHRFPAAFEARFPRAVAILRQWDALAHADAFAAHLTPLVSDAERRAVGLFALLTHQSGHCLEAWNGLASSLTSDPLVQFFAGELHRERGEPALAYPLLLRAYDACPDAPRIGAAACSAAIECGDLEAARRLLVRLEPAGFQAEDSTLLRVRGDLAWASGDLEGARDAYCAAIVHEHNPVAMYRMARMSELSGDARAAVVYMQAVLASYPAWAELRTGIERVSEAWWRERSSAERRAALVAEVGASSLQPVSGSPWHELYGHRPLVFPAVSHLLAGRTLHLMLVARARYPAPPASVEDRALSGVPPWARPARLTVAATAGAAPALADLCFLAGVFHPSGGQWCEVPAPLRMALAHLAFGWDTLAARAATCEDEVQRALRRCMGRGLRCAVRAMLERP